MIFIRRDLWATECTHFNKYIIIGQIKTNLAPKLPELYTMSRGFISDSTKCQQASDIFISFLSSMNLSHYNSLEYILLLLASKHA